MYKWIFHESHKSISYDTKTLQETVVFLRMSRGQMLLLNRARGILCMHPANERQRYNVRSSLLGWAHTQNDPWEFMLTTYYIIFIYNFLIWGLYHVITVYSWIIGCARWGHTYPRSRFWWGFDNHQWNMLQLIFLCIICDFFARIQSYILATVE